MRGGIVGCSGGFTDWILVGENGLGVFVEQWKITARVTWAVDSIYHGTREDINNGLRRDIRLGEEATPDICR